MGPDTAEVIDASKTAISTSSLITHIIERRLEYLIGTLLAYQMGLLDTLVSQGSQCLA